jgi:hypothetical protein
MQNSNAPAFIFKNKASFSKTKNATSACQYCPNVKTRHYHQKTAKSPSHSQKFDFGCTVRQPQHPPLGTNIIYFVTADAVLLPESCALKLPSDEPCLINIHMFEGEKIRTMVG